MALKTSYRDQKALEELELVERWNSVKGVLDRVLYGE